MKKTLSIILALSLVVSMMVGLSFSASAGVSSYMANVNFTGVTVEKTTPAADATFTTNGWTLYQTDSKFFNAHTYTEEDGYPDLVGGKDAEANQGRLAIEDGVLKLYRSNSDSSQAYNKPATPPILTYPFTGTNISGEFANDKTYVFSFDFETPSGRDGRGDRGFEIGLSKKTDSRPGYTEDDVSAGDSDRIVSVTLATKGNQNANVSVQSGATNASTNLSPNYNFATPNSCNFKFEYTPGTGAYEVYLTLSDGSVKSATGTYTGGGTPGCLYIVPSGSTPRQSKPSEEGLESELSCTIDNFEVYDKDNLVPEPASISI